MHGGSRGGPDGEEVTIATRLGTGLAARGL